MLTVLQGDCRLIMPTLDAGSVDAIVTDPPAGIAFMGKEWDKDKGGRDCWIGWMCGVAGECLRVLKPGGHALVWSLPRTSHWTATAWEDAGFELRDRLAHIFGSGFPKSLDVSKSIDKANGRQFQDRYALGRHIREQREAAGISREEVNGWLQSATKCEHYESNSPGFTRVPTLADWIILRDRLQLCNTYVEMIERVEAERVVIGRSRQASGETNWFTAAGDFDITAPATDAAKQWDGWGTALKPAIEDWWLMRKPLEKGLTVAENVLRHGTGALNIDGCRVGFDGGTTRGANGSNAGKARNVLHGGNFGVEKLDTGRWPANVILSYPEDEYELRSDITREDRQELLKWMYENA